MSTTIANNSTECIPDTSVTTVVFPCLYSIVFVVALVLNSLAASIFFNIQSTSTLRVYLKNLVVADMLMTLTIPVKVLSDAGVGSWRLRAFYCRYSAVLFYSCMYISLVFLGLISLDRYLKVVHPFRKFALQRVRVGRALSVTVWAVMLSALLPNSILSDRPPEVNSEGKLKCSSLKSELGKRWYNGSNYFCQVVFWCTLVLMVVCYGFISRKVYESYKTSRSSSNEASRRAKARVLVVVIVFFVCFAPFHFIRVPYTLTQTQKTAHDCRAENIIRIAKDATLWLSATNVCQDPLMYVFLCTVFRKRLMATLRRKPLPQGTTEFQMASST